MCRRQPLLVRAVGRCGLLSIPQLNSQGIYCSLMTGQERREVPFATHVSCTIEMASTTNEYEVAVIDEIQMLADEQRGSSWTAVSYLPNSRCERTLDPSCVEPGSRSLFEC